MSIFNSVKIKNRKRVPFNLSHTVRLTTEFGRLTPIMCEPVLPADKFKLSTVLSVQFAPMTFPVMERFKAYVHYFFVPNRLLWNHWEDFITGGESGIEEYAYPVIKAGDNLEAFSGFVSTSNFGFGSLFDYLGFPAVDVNDPNYGGFDSLDAYPKYFDALPFKAYQLVWNEWYRDQNLEDEFDIRPDLDGVQSPNGDGYLENGLMKLRYRAWRKDYFTSALPDPQRGPDVTLPLVGDYEITGEGNIPLTVNGYQDPEDPNITRAMVWRQVESYQQAATPRSVPASQIEAPGDGAPIPGDPVVYKGNVNAGVVANSLSLNNPTEDGVRSATINEVRRAFAIQRVYELCARVGGRYMENILGNFGVRAGDARLQRPEYLGGSVVPITVGDVLQTSESGETPLGMPAGIAGGTGQVKEFTKHFTEHGWIIGILSIVPEACYMQGIPRKFLKRDRFDFAWPLLANLGEQEIQSQELYFDFGATDEQNKQGFGYAPRYSEYKFGVNSIHGDFRGNLADFHDARIFSSRPALNAEFVTVKPSGNDSGLNRIFAVTGENYDHLWVNLYNDCRVLRKLPKYGTPI